jgi:hypothetical protein
MKVGGHLHSKVFLLWGKKVLLLLLLLLLFNCNWVDTRWQQYSTHLHTNCTQNTENGTYITATTTTNCVVQAVSRLYELYPGICLTTEEKYGKTSDWVVEKCPDIPVAAVQYTFTHKQYTEHRERNIHNNNINLGSAGRVPSLRVIPWHLPYNWGKSTENLRVVEKYPDVPVAAVQYTFTYKQYTEQHKRQNTQNGAYIKIRIFKLLK